MTSPSVDFPPSWDLSPYLDDVPAADVDDVLALLPSLFRDNPGTPQDELLDALVEAYAKHASALAAYGAQADPANATGSALILHARGRGISKALGESEDSLRSRTLSDAALVTPAAILEAVNRIVAKFTDKRAYYWEEPNDGIFVHSVRRDGFGNVLFDASVPSDLAGFYVFSWDPTRARLQQVQHPFRAYVARSAVADCTPTHGLLFGLTGVEVDNTDSKCPNQRGLMVIALPAIGRYGETPEAAYVHSIGVADALGKSVFSIASGAASLGATAWRSDADPATMVTQVQALLETTRMWPSKITLFLDPNL